MRKDLIIQNMVVATDDYNQLIDNISSLWTTAKEKAINAVNTELLEANWQTGKYIVEFEQGGKVRAEYGKQLLMNLAKDLTLKNGRGFSRSNLLYMRKFYLSFPICETVSHIDLEPCVEDVNTHLMPHLSLHPALHTCNADTILRAIMRLY